MHLNASPSTMQKWEKRQKQPNGRSPKLLDIVDQKGLDVLGKYKPAQLTGSRCMEILDVRQGDS